MQKGNIGVTTENIFPVIKKFLYSDHEIFLRELVSNAVDATQKLKTVASTGEFQGSLDDLKVEVKIDADQGTLTVVDNGIGMTAEDVDKYINQIAFSGAEEFLKKYKDTANAIIGHFGLGFYSAFMVAKKVEIRTKSYVADAPAVSWVCDGSPEYEMTQIEKEERGTEIILYIDDDEKEFLEKARIEALLKKHCRFLPVPIVFGKEQEWKDGKYVDTERDNVINNIVPIWSKKPTELTDADYIEFYHAIQPAQDDPLFWIHLNVDYPFTLTGVLYFPKIKNNLDIRKDRIQLYCNQVFVTDSVEGVVPEFLTLLQGVIDSPDIPLNVSRSYLQSDRNVKKISSYITKKVSARLEEIAKNSAKEFEEKWNDIKVFIHYGMLTDEKFCEAAMKFALLEDTNDKFYKIEDYKKLITDNQTDKDGNLIVLYSTDRVAQYSYVKEAENKGYNVLQMNGQLDSALIGLLEQKVEKCRFCRVDSDVIDNLIKKEDSKADDLTDAKRNAFAQLFKSQIPAIKGSEFIVSFAKLGEAAAPTVITQSEYMRRMKDMASLQAGMSFYGELPDSYQLTLNLDHPVVAGILSQATDELMPSVDDVDTQLSAKEALLKALRDANKDAAGSQDSEIESTQKEIDELTSHKNETISAYASGNSKVKQLVDIALLGNGLLRGADLEAFIKRSISML